MTTRRTFIQIIPIAGAALLGAPGTHAADVDPKEPQAAGARLRHRCHQGRQGEVPEVRHRGSSTRANLATGAAPARCSRVRTWQRRAGAAHGQEGLSS